MNRMLPGLALPVIEESARDVLDTLRAHADKNPESGIDTNRFKHREHTCRVLAANALSGGLYLGFRTVIPFDINPDKPLDIVTFHANNRSPSEGDRVSFTSRLSLRSSPIGASELGLRAIMEHRRVQTTDGPLGLRENYSGDTSTLEIVDPDQLDKYLGELRAMAEEVIKW